MIKISGVTPPPNSKLNLQSQNISFLLSQDVSAIDISTLIVNLDGIPAIRGTTLLPGFNGLLSEILPSGSGYSISIDKEVIFNLGETPYVQIQVKDFAGTYLNYSFVFGITPNEPILVRNSPVNNSTIFANQLILLEFDDTADSVDVLSATISVNGVQFVSSGLLTADNGPASSIISSATGATFQIDLGDRLIDGKFVVNYSISDLPGNTLIGKFKFKTTLKSTPSPANFKIAGFLGFFQGAKKAWDLGIGNSVQVEWGTPVDRGVSYESFLILYHGIDRLSLFDSPPKYISLSSSNSFIFDTLVADQPGYFAVRALESVIDVYNFSNLTQYQPGVYTFPISTVLASQISDTALSIPVTSVAGYPVSGLIQIGLEVLRYISLDVVNNSFNLPTNGRGVLGTLQSVHGLNDPVSLFRGTQDDNAVIIKTLATFQDGFAGNKIVNSTGVLVTDYKENDRKFFQGFDFCGYHQVMPSDALTGQNDCGTYFGGEFNGFRGFNIYDRMLNREEVILNQTGEPILLLSRIWDGPKCDCITSRRNSPKVKSCPNCFGTTFDGGYLQFCNLRREDRRIMMSFAETTEDLKSNQYGGLQQEFEPGAWTLPMPAIKDRDILVRFDFVGNIEFIYEVLTSSREKLMYRHFGRQKLTLKRMDKTDIIYTLISTALLNNDFCPATVI